ncbi:MAG TPA: septum formation initiator family protein [Bryobacteraceae bacterium]|nr:septum formation initiator family protein [Bryobacteraceae bacterium]
MKVSVGRLVYLFAFLSVASYAYVTLRGPKGVHALMDKQAQIHLMEKRNADLARQIEQLRERNNRITDNPSEQERIIREQLKLVRPGEKVFITGPPEKP